MKALKSSTFLVLSYIYMGGFMCLSDLSTCELLLLANDIALALSKDLNAEETALLSAFLTSIADQLALIAIKKEFNAGTEAGATFVS